MAALSITAANVAKVSGNVASGIAGTTITAGQALYLDAATTTLKLCDADLSAAGADCVGIALHGSLAGQPLTYQIDGTITIGATMTLGEPYFASATAGGIGPAADLVSPVRTTLIGIAGTTTILTIKLYTSGVVHA